MHPHSATPLHDRTYRLNTLFGQPDPTFALAATPRRTHLRPLTRSRPRAHTLCNTTTLTTHNKVPTLSTGIESQPDLPIISCVEDWAYLMHTHTPPTLRPSRTNTQTPWAQQ
jgi:hypothetical protein